MLLHLMEKMRKERIEFCYFMFLSSINCMQLNSRGNDWLSNEIFIHVRFAQCARSAQKRKWVMIDLNKNSILPPVLTPLGERIWCQHTLAALLASQGAKISAKLRHIGTPLAITIKVFCLSEMMSSIRSFPKYVRVRDCQMLVRLNGVGRPKQNLIAVGEAFWQIGTTWVFENWCPVINRDARRIS